jgi:hypothetical protein
MLVLFIVKLELMVIGGTMASEEIGKKEKVRYKNRSTSGLNKKGHSSVYE